MDSNSYKQSEMEINLKEIIWDLLSQWKAVLIAALLVAALVTGAKYSKDMKAYNAAQAEKKAEVQTTATVEEQIDDVLDALPEDERATVMAILNQNKWIEEQKEYINNSILINTDPTNQRTLCLEYYIDAGKYDETVGSSIIKGYTAYLGSDEVIKSVGEAIDPEISSNYISELISTNSNTQAPSAGDAGTVLEVFIVLPDDSDADKVEKALTGEIMKMSPDISKNIRQHDISLIFSGEKYLYNEPAVNKRTDILYSINNLQNNSKNMKLALSDGQKAAIESIKVIEKNAEEANNEQEKTVEQPQPELTKPGISKKYAILGFVLGALMYAFAYVILLIVRGRVNCAGDTARYSRARLVGEVYKKVDHKGLHKLLHSDLVNRYRYKGKTDSAVQIEKASDRLEAICEHERIKEAILINLTKDSNRELVEILVEKMASRGLNFRPIEIANDVDEKDLISTTHSIMVMDSNTKTSGAVKLASLCNDYDINVLGSVFIGEL